MRNGAQGDKDARDTMRRRWDPEPGKKDWQGTRGGMGLLWVAVEESLVKVKGDSVYLGK